jgi:hypothetical protein
LLSIFYRLFEKYLAINEYYWNFEISNKMFVFFIFQNFTPFTGEVGGCPFKHFDRHHLNGCIEYTSHERDLNPQL